MTTPEGDVKKALKKRISFWGRHAYPFWPVQMGYGARVVDCLLCYNGDYIVIEVKAPGEKLRRAQAYVLAQMKMAGAKVFVIDNLKDAVDFNPNAPGLTYDEIILRFEATAGDLSDARSGPDSLQRIDRAGD